MATLVSATSEGGGGDKNRRFAAPLVILISSAFVTAAALVWLHPDLVSPIEEAALFQQAVGANAPKEGDVRWDLIDMWSIRATVEFPDRGLSLTVTIAPNTDESLPATFLIEVVTVASPEFMGRGIATLAGVSMKPRPGASTVLPLSGVVAEIESNVFWVALSASEPDRSTNLQMLGNWHVFELPFTDWHDQSGSVVFEKGISGRRVFRAAWAAWAAWAAE